MDPEGHGKLQYSDCGANLEHSKPNKQTILKKIIIQKIVASQYWSAKHGFFKKHITLVSGNGFFKDLHVSQIFGFKSEIMAG